MFFGTDFKLNKQLFRQLAKHPAHENQVLAGGVAVFHAPRLLAQSLFMIRWP
jgi:hypothetical protein